jgi:hypothetical protein
MAMIDSSGSDRYRGVGTLKDFDLEPFRSSGHQLVPDLVGSEWQISF